jgi:type I restriction enzyme S subunit
VEQQKIAAILTAVDDKLNVIGRQTEATQILKLGLLQTLFSRGVGIRDADGRWSPHIEFIDESSRLVPASWTNVRLGDIAPLVRRPVEINLDDSYPELGLRSYGKGTFHKPPLSGAEVGNKRLFEIQAGDLLFSNVFAWEGAVAVARPEDDGRFGSHRYITCRVDASKADTMYLFRYLTTPVGIAALTLASPGGAGRNKTLGLAALANISIPLPPLTEQKEITKILDAVDAKLGVLTSKLSSFQTLKRGLMQKLLTGEWRVNAESTVSKREATVPA